MTGNGKMLCALLSSAAGLGFATPVWAQDEADQPPAQADAAAPVGQAAEEEEAILITGSRIARRDLTSASPLAVVSDEEFRLSGAVNVEQVMNTLPQVIPGTTAFSNNPGGGVATLDLRGLGAQRNLVLVNGRRWMFFSPAQTVDLNTIPSFLIDSVDVVTGGASAVYGSDAVAGVINFRLRTDLDGMIAGAQYSVTEEGDGPRYNAYIAFGSQFADGRGHVAAYAEYFNRGAIMAGDRDFSRFALGDTANGLAPVGSATIPQGRHTTPATVSVAGTVLPVGQGTNFGTSFGAIFRTPGVSSPYQNPADSHNYAPENYLMVPQERWLLGGYGEYAVTDDINVYSEVSFINNRVANELAATPVTGNVDLNVAAQSANLSAADFTALQTIAARQQAANAAAVAAGVAQPFGGLAAGNVRLGINRRVSEVGSRNTLNERSAWRVLVGSRGSITDTLDYDIYYFFARNRDSNIQEGNVSRSAFNREVSAGRCNVFGAGTLSAACVDAISITAQNATISQLEVAQASISGPLYTFGSASDPVAFAMGVEWRRMEGRFIPDTALSSGDVVGFNAGQPTQGDYDVKEAFAELRIPIIQDGFIHRLELNGAARYSDYSLGNVGGVWTYAGGVELAPVRDITFRGQYQRAVRAPNVGELFGGQAIGFPPATDPCSDRNTIDRSDTVRQLCIATGVPADLVFTPGVQANAQIQGAFGGNPNLQEEVADTWTVGAVVRPRFVPRLSITVDYYDIEIANAVAPTAGGVNNILSLCYFTLQDAGHPICQLIDRNPLTGEIVAPNVVDARFSNLGGLATSGVDLQLDYSQPLDFSLMGNGDSRLSFFLLGTWTRESSFTPIAGLDEVNEGAGRFGLIVGEPIPEWKWSTRLSWMDGPLTTTFRWRHTGSVRDDDDDTAFVVERIGAYDLFDLAFGLDVSDNLTLNMGINNLFDKDPPVMGNNQQQSNTFPGTYDVIGRDFFVSANLRF